MGLRMNKAEFISWVRSIGADYHPSDAALQHIADVELVAFVGPTGAGKSTIMSELGMPVVTNDMTRDPRKGEEKDPSLHFVTDFDAASEDLKAGEYIQFVVSRSDEFYGTRRSSYPTKGACSMPIIAGAIPTFQGLGFKKLTQIYIMPPGYIEWMRRVGAHQVTDMSHRMTEAITSLLSALDDRRYQFVLNDDLDSAVADVRSILKGEKVSEHRSQLAKETAGVLLKRLGNQDEGL